MTGWQQQTGGVCKNLRGTAGDLEDTAHTEERTRATRGVDLQEQFPDVANAQGTLAVRAQSIHGERFYSW
ncbi:hypothetical protein D3C72_2492670 [compost metagenome]